MNSLRTDREILEEISHKFQIYGELLHAEVCKIGHLNETYTATTTRLARVFVISINESTQMFLKIQTM